MPRVRDARIDLIRGVAMFVMIADHASYGFATPLARITGNGTWIVSAAELFIVASGLGAGWAYRDSTPARSPWGVARRYWSRAALVYTAAVFLGLVSLAFPDRPVPPEPLPGDVMLTERDANNSPLPAEVQDEPSIQSRLPGITLLRDEGGDILHLYVLLFVLAPAVIVLLRRRHTYIVIALSAISWGCQEWVMLQGDGEQVLGISARLPIFQAFGVWAIFAAVAWHRERISEAMRKFPVSLWAGLSVVTILSLWELHQDLFGQASSLVTDLLRLGSTMTVGFTLLGAMSMLHEEMNSAVGWLLRPLGRRPLAAVIIHLLILAPVPVDLIAQFSPFGIFALQIATLVATRSLVTLWGSGLTRYRVSQARI